MSVRTAPGNVTTETKSTVTVPLDQARRLSDGTPIVTKDDFWDWIESTPIGTLGKYDVQINVYRRGLNGKSESLCEQLNFPPDQVNFSRRWLKTFYGGGPYKIMVKMEKQLRFNIELDIEGLPKNPAEVEAAKTGHNGSGAGGPSYTPSSEMGFLVQALRESNAALLAEIRSSRGGDLQTDALRNSMSLGTEVLRQAVPAVGQIVANAAAAGGGGGAMSTLQDKLFTAMIERLLNPPQPPDALATFERVSTVLKNLAPAEGGGGGETIAQTFVRVLPQVLDKVSSGMATMAQLREQEIRAMQMRGGAPPPTINIPPAQPSFPAPQPPAPSADPSASAPPPPPVPPAGMGMLEFLEVGIARIANNPNLTVEAAATEMLILLDAYVPEMVNGTVEDANAESELLKMFREHPILQQVPQNPRLTELIQKFLEKARESRTPLAATAAEQPAEQPPFGGAPPAIEPPPAQPVA